MLDILKKIDKLGLITELVFYEDSKKDFEMYNMQH